MSAKRPALLACLLTLIAAPSYGQCMTITGNPTSFTYQASYSNVTDPTNIGNLNTSAFQSGIDAAADRWNSLFSTRTLNYTVTAGSGVVFDVNDDPGLQGQPYFDGNSTINVPVRYAIPGTLNSGEHLVADMQHEMGHKFGYPQAASGLMANPSPGVTDFTTCDHTAVNAHFWADSDSDGHSPYVPSTSGSYDCDDGDAAYHAYSESPECWDSDGFGYIQYPTQDFNCDGIQDYYNTPQQLCPYGYNTPLLIDVAGNGFRLTDADGGVLFDLNGVGARQQVPWTAATSDDAWLALDRNGNGLIDDGRELFGNATAQNTPKGQVRHGFAALQVFDSTEEGGNGDGWIDAKDRVFASLLLWTDKSHDGVSQPGELTRVAATGLRSISLDYRESKRVDQFGNEFRYIAKIVARPARDFGPVIVDVFLGAQNVPAWRRR